MLTDGGYQLVQRDAGTNIPYQIRTVGSYLVIEANNGVTLIWDKKTSIYIKLSPDFNVSIHVILLHHRSTLKASIDLISGLFTRRDVCVVCAETMMAMQTMISQQGVKKLSSIPWTLGTAGSSLPLVQRRWWLKIRVPVTPTGRLGLRGNAASS